MAEQPIMRIRGVHKFFSRGDEQIDVLKNLSLDVAKGEFLGIMGPSGSGKTTLLNLIAGLDRPSEGEVWIGDRLISKMSEAALASWRTRSIGFIFQFYHLLPVLTAYENVELPLLLLSLSAAERKQQVLTALDLVGLSNRLAHRPGQLSGGQQQRVGVARALAADPPVLLMDEPFGAVDPITRSSLQDELLRLQTELGKTIVFVTHDFGEAVKLGDRIAVLGQKSKVLQYDTPQAILASPADDAVAGFVGSGASLRQLGLLRVKDVELREHPVAKVDDTVESARN
jgi:osmoprotectant transport system ATP-binding protein